MVVNKHLGCVFFFVLFLRVEQCFGQSFSGNQWTTQQILGVVFGCISLIGLLVTLICCCKNCHDKKKFARQGPHPDERHYDQGYDQRHDRGHYNQNQAYRNEPSEKMGYLQQEDYYGDRSRPPPYSYHSQPPRSGLGYY
ncbi:hypothetical protein SNE40_014745 [Patella caerulea]|uniref:Uncharacterized protein n=1 Tax=Patella caerulea TaxID=87958 RepID=A0AAN8PTY7_PATCE